MRKKIKQYINKWLSRGYKEGLPDEADATLENLNKVPSYRLICRAILKNDLNLVSLGFSKEKCEAYSMLKRIEIEARNERI